MYLSTTFNHSWHIFKFWLPSNSRDSWLTKSFLSGTFQRVLLNGQTSDWETIQAGVPQGSILGPLFFLISTNGLTDNLNSKVKLFADDTSLMSEVSDPFETANILKKDLRKLHQ